VVNEAFTGGGAQADARSTENHFQITDMAHWTRSRHLVKFGLNIPDFSRRGQSDRTNTNGTYYFSSLADYAAARPYSFLVQRGDGHLALWQKEIGLFVQDEFKLRSNLSLSIGLRWDWQGYLADHNNFAPRLAVAWSPDRKRKTVLRAGGGIFFDRTGESAIGDTLRFDGHHLSRILLSNPSYPEPGLLSGAQPANLVRFAHDLRSAYLGQYGFTAERQLRKSLTLTAGYTAMRGIKSFRSLDLNTPLPPLYAARPDPTVGTLREIQSAGRLASHSLDLTLRGSITTQFKGTVQYTLGRAFNDNNGINALPANSRDLSLEWARAPFDARHRLNLIGTLRPEKLLSLGVRLACNTATPYTMTTGRDGNNDGAASDRPPGIRRNSLSGYGAVNLDLRWSKEFPLTRSGKEEAPRAGIVVDAFNALNHVNLNNPVGNLSSPFFGQAVAAKSARRLQMTLEFKF
jgi:outer membrane receptor protein involved in Fe transport